MYLDFGDELVEPHNEIEITSIVLPSTDVIETNSPNEEKGI